MSLYFRRKRTADGREQQTGENSRRERTADGREQQTGENSRRERTADGREQQTGDGGLVLDEIQIQGKEGGISIRLYHS
jgi:hypothetical protein